jgi:predicted transcriptional regulator
MNILLDKEISAKVKQLANEMGLGEDEVIAKIVEWYFEDNEK